MTQNSWIDSTLGQYVLDKEQQLFDVAVADIFGFNAVQMGLLQMNALKSSRIPTRLPIDNNAGHCYCESDYLPFTDNCIDLICMPHILEFSENPHQTLREAERVLVPEGHLILTGFNPISAWGIKRTLKKDVGYPWQGHFFTISRIKDWLALLGMEYVSGQMQCYALPINNQKWLNRLHGLETLGEKCWPMLGGVYMIIAKKRVVNITLLKPNWKKSVLPAQLVVNTKKTPKNVHKMMQINSKNIAFKNSQKPLKP